MLDTTCLHPRNTSTKVFILDGTTLTSKKTVNPLLVEYLQTLRKRGLLVLIATGRTIFEIRKILPKEFKVDGIVASNGMNIFDASKQIIKKDIPSNTVQQLIDQSIEFGIHHEIYHQDGTVTAMKTPFQSETTKLKLHNFRKYIEWTSSIHTNNVEKIIFFDDHTPHVANWFENLKRMQKSLEFSAALSSSHLIDVNGAGASKATGTTLLLSKLNIAFDHVMAFGDGGNDIPLFKKVGKSIAMKNARKEVQLHADEISKYTNDENGLYHHLHQLFH